MAFTGVRSTCLPTTIQGPRVTMVGITETWSGASTVVATVAAAVSVDLKVTGDINGHLRIPFADPETMNGVLMPSELGDAFVGLTQAVGSSTLGLIVEEVYAN